MFEVTVRGFDRVEAAMRRLTVAAQTALRIEGEIEMAEAKKRTPVRTGALRASGRVEDLGPGELGIRWAFGGAAITYAVPVHENLAAFHPVGQAKYLESVLAESAPYLTERVARRMRELLGT